MGISIDSNSDSGHLKRKADTTASAEVQQENGLTARGLFPEIPSVGRPMHRRNEALPESLNFQDPYPKTDKSTKSNEKPKLHIEESAQPNIPLNDLYDWSGPPSIPGAPDQGLPPGVPPYIPGGRGEGVPPVLPPRGGTPDERHYFYGGPDRPSSPSYPPTMPGDGGLPPAFPHGGVQPDYEHSYPGAPLKTPDSPYHPFGQRIPVPDIMQKDPQSRSFERMLAHEIAQRLDQSLANLAREVNSKQQIPTSVREAFFANLEGKPAPSDMEQRMYRYLTGSKAGVNKLNAEILSRSQRIGVDPTVMFELSEEPDGRKTLLLKDRYSPRILDSAGIL